MSVTQAAKANAFRELHRSGTFVIPNPWDAGSARVLEGLGFKALATTSAGFAQTLGRTDGHVTVDEKIAHCAALCALTAIPVSADLENGFAHKPADAARTLMRAAEAGCVGGSLEDYANDSDINIYPLNLAVERIQAAAEALRALPFPFTLTARAENLLRGVNDLDDTIARLQAYSRAGADVLYAPGLTTVEQIRAVLAEVDKPLNVLVPMVQGATVETMRELGVRRLSLGSALANAALAPLLNAGREMMEHGTFAWLAAMAPGREIRQLLDQN